MQRVFVIVISVVLILHGLIHLMGLVAYWPLAEIKELPYKTTLLVGRLDLGAAGIRVFSVLWLVAAAGFVIAAIGLIAQTGWWRPVMAGTVLLSLLITALDWAAAFRGTLIDIVILIGVIFAPRIASLFNAS